MINVAVKPGYGVSDFNFWLDLAATVSLVLDISFLYEALMDAFGVSESSGGSGQVCASHTVCYERETCMRLGAL